MDYYGLMTLLEQRHRDYDIVDDYYLQRARFEQAAIQVGPEKYRAIVLPPMKVIARSSLEKIREFYDKGGAVIAYGALPGGSTESGWDDPEVARHIRAIFGVEAGSVRDSENRNAQGGRAIFISHGLEGVATALNRAFPADFQVVDGSAERLYYLHRVKDGRDFYWVANDDGSPRRILVSAPVPGQPEVWDPSSGAKREIASWVNDGRTVFPLDLSAWDGLYVVFRPVAPRPGVAVARTNLEGYTTREEGQSLRLPGRVPASVEKIYADGAFGRVEKANPSPVQAQVLGTRGWRFRVAADQVRLHYAREMVAPAGDGRNLGFADPDFNDSHWEQKSLSRERWTITEWNLIGPFPNPDHLGFNKPYPPEQECNLKARYPGLDGQDVAWHLYQSSSPEIQTGEALALANREGVAYALTYVYSPSERDVEGILAAENPKLFVNGKLVFGHHPLPRYYELRDGFAFKPVVHLKPGWNEILVKLEHDRLPPVFSFRLSDRWGLPLRDLIAAGAPGDPVSVAAKRKQNLDGLERWYRMELPPGAQAFDLPAWPSVQQAYLNGKPIPLPSQGRLKFPSLDWSRPAILALKLAATDELVDYPTFEMGPVEYRLGSWTGAGLSFFSGEASYEKTFDLDPKLNGKKIELDCGEVGVTAEVWLNGKKAGERVWQPFRLDVTDYLRPGQNQLKIIVTNTDANARAEANLQRYLERQRLPGGGAVVPLSAVGVNGLIGPVRLIPYLEVRLEARLGNR